MSRATDRVSFAAQTYPIRRIIQQIVIPPDNDAVIFDGGTTTPNIRSDRGADQSPIDNTKDGITNLGSDTSHITAGATGNYSTITGGDSNVASGDYSTADGGFHNIASGNFSHAEGTNTVASNSGSHSEGESTIASGPGAHSEGGSTVASGNLSHAEGSGTLASGNTSHAEGNNTQATGNFSHAEGFGTVASGTFSHAEGNTTIASGISSHAEGDSSIASGDGSHAEGVSNQANNFASHAEGDHNISSAASSHTEGSSNTASGDFSHAQGVGSVASRTSQDTRSSNGNIPGTNQQSEIIFYGGTPGLIPTESVELGFGPVYEQFLLEDNKVYGIIINATVKGEITSPAPESASALIIRKAIVRQDAGVVTVVDISTTEIYASPIAKANWDIDVTSSVAPDRLSINFNTGASTASAFVAAQVEFGEVVLP